MKELAVVSGKGGTGKTSIVASFAALAAPAMLADCDVDAADLHLVLDPEIRRRELFHAGMKAVILPAKCTACDECRRLCRFDAIVVEDGRYRIDHVACDGCGVCVRFCPEAAIIGEHPPCGEWFISETRHGPMVHARLGVAEANSGKLVTLVRREARRLAEERGLDVVIIDGSPGIGCPVIASVTGADLVLAVTEPTQSGLHDVQRAHALAKHFQLPVLLCINKFDLNAGMTAEIERWAATVGVPVAGRVRYDPEVTRAQIAGRSIVEHDADGPVAGEMASLWEAVCQGLNGAAPRQAQQ